ncbi:ABC transporter permease [Asanoa sp. WMMD1127]|uniref:ABC transporter permease n=1 Tax=Asanoa sp. WMMD1127 TaxID=3016107 RepID=UPI002415EBFF|nr:ABC transporter permease [Asanoa sp. WMMD1127]MDG4824945.1 ABC transporter permease [Asanoa sp. WMMD1127]
MRNAVLVEAWKLGRSRLAWLTVAAFSLAVAVCGLFTYLQAAPGRADRLGLAGAKAQLAGVSADWPSYLGLLAQAVAVGGFLIFGLTVIWIFGREFSDRTVLDLLATSTSRASIVLAKFLVAGTWSALLAVYAALLGLAFGGALRLPGWSSQVAGTGLGRLLGAAVLTALVVTTLGLAASLGRGYLAAVGVLFGVLFAARSPRRWASAIGFRTPCLPSSVARRVKARRTSARSAMAWCCWSRWPAWAARRRSGGTPTSPADVSIGHGP